MERSVNVKQAVKGGTLGAGAALLAYCGLSSLAARLLASGTVGEGRAAACVWTAAFLAAFAGAKLAALRAGGTPLPAGVCALLFWAVVQLLGFLLYDGLEASRSLWLALPILLGGSAAYLLRFGRKGKGRRKHAHRGRK